MRLVGAAEDRQRREHLPPSRRPFTIWNACSGSFETSSGIGNARNGRSRRRAFPGRADWSRWASARTFLAQALPCRHRPRLARRRAQFDGLLDQPDEQRQIPRVRHDRGRPALRARVRKLSSFRRDEHDGIWGRPARMRTTSSSSSASPPSRRGVVAAVGQRAIASWAASIRSTESVGHAGEARRAATRRGRRPGAGGLSTRRLMDITGHGPLPIPPVSVIVGYFPVRCHDA
jgi:hypothetical protein